MAITEAAAPVNVVIQGTCAIVAALRTAPCLRTAERRVAKRRSRLALAPRSSRYALERFFASDR